MGKKIQAGVVLVGSDIKAAVGYISQGKPLMILGGGWEKITKGG